MALPTRVAPRRPIRTICAAGDSRTAFAFSSASGLRYAPCARGHIAYALSLADYPVMLSGPSQYGVGGDSSADLLARYAAVLADPADAVVTMIGINDAGKSIVLGAVGTPGTTFDNIDQTIRQNIAAGKVTILCNETPRVNYGSAQGLADAKALVAWLSTAEARYPVGWVFVADTWGALVDQATVNLAYPNGCQPLANTMIDDSLHPNARGGYLLGIAIAQTLRRAGSRFRWHRPYHDGEAILSANPTLLGTGGTGSNGASGGVPNNWFLIGATTGNALVALSKETVNDRNRQVLTLSGTAPTGTPQIKLYTPATTLPAVGQFYDMRATVMKLLPGSTGIRGLSLFTEQVGATMQAYSHFRDGSGTITNDVLSDGFDGPAFAPPVAVQSGATAVNGGIVIDLAPGQPVSGVIKLQDAALKLAAAA